MQAPTPQELWATLKIVGAYLVGGYTLYIVTALLYSTRAVKKLISYIMK